MPPAPNLAPLAPNLALYMRNIYIYDTVTTVGTIIALQSCEGCVRGFDESIGYVIPPFPLAQSSSPAHPLSSTTPNHTRHRCFAPSPALLRVRLFASDPQFQSRVASTSTARGWLLARLFASDRQSKAMISTAALN
jgi:hypothetical protein